MTTKDEMIRRAMRFPGYSGKSQGERDFNAYQESRVMGLVWDRNIGVSGFDKQGRLQTFLLQFDFLRPKFSGGFDINFEIDGKGHKSKNDKWEDGLRLKVVAKVIHIGAPMCVPKMWDKLDKELQKALDSKEPVCPIDSEYV